MKHIAILGSTGSIGRSALSVVETHADRLAIAGLAAGDNDERLAEQVRRYRPRIVSMATGAAIDRLRGRLGDIRVNAAATSGSTAVAPGEVALADTGRDGLVQVATHPDVDIVLCASSGTEALEAVLAAIDAGKTIALANKEVLVMAGGIVMEAARRAGVAILPVDSEHNAIHQCLHARTAAEVKRIILTASGGPFRGRTASQLAGVTREDALRHPTWQMGRKITIDSATLMNKGLEVIEARWLFDLEPGQIDVIVHPQSVVHSMVELTDGSLIAQLGVTDMRLPIQYAFTYPERWPAPLPSLNLANAGRLEFLPPDMDVFPCLALAYQALRSGPSFPVVLNAANEVAVELFLDNRLSFHAIAHVIAETMAQHTPCEVASLAQVRAVDREAREHARTIARGVESKV